MPKKLFLTLLSPLLFLLISGCRTTEVTEMKLGMGVPSGKQKFAPVPTKELTLDLVSSRNIHAGEKAELIFSLIYTGNSKIVIPEWHTNENENITIFIQPYLTGMKTPDPARWIELAPPIKKPVFHHPLTLMPGNRVMVVKELPFVSKLQVSQGKMRRYFIKAKVNLQSLDLTSKVEVLQILSHKKTGDK